MRSARLVVSSIAVLACLGIAGARADVKVGVTAAVNPQAIGQPPTEPERVLMVGTDNFANEKITTGPGGQLQLLFVDGSSISVGPDANMSIDQYVYDPNTKTGKLAINATQGVLRFVGGAISKAGEATISTPVGTAGIRGGIGLFSITPGGMNASLLFGKSLTVTANGVSQTITRVGFQITVLLGQAPGAPVRLTGEALRNQLGQFQGKRGGQQQGGTGGAGGQQQGGGDPDAALANSGVSGATGSNLAPDLLGLGTTTFNNVFNPNTLTTLQNVITQQSNTSTGGGSFQLFGHFYSDPAYLNGSFNSSNGFATANTIANGNIIFTVNGSTLSFMITTDAGPQVFSLPFIPGSSSSFAASVINGGRANGTVLITNDPSKFFAAFGTYTPPPGNDCGNGKSSGCGFGFFGGTPTQANASSAFPTTGFATYNAISAVTDPGKAPKVPFVGGLSTPAPGAAGLTVSPIYTVFGNTQPGTTGSNQPIGTSVQASVWIQGTGANQNSGLVGMTSVFFQEQNSTVSAAGGVVGMTRDCATCVLNRYASSASSDPIAPTPGSGLTNGNAIYGTNANYIVYGPDNVSLPAGSSGGTVPDVRNTAAAQSIPFDTLQSGGPEFYATIAQQASSSATTSAPRTSQTLNGYTAGVMDVRNSSSGAITQRMFGGLGGGPTIQIGTNASSNTLFANFNFTDQSPGSQNGDNYHVAFGNQTNNAGTRSAFINDQIFGSRESRDSNGNPLTTLNGQTASFTRAILISSGVAPIDLQTFAGAGVTACTCAFMQWGWWIGEVQNPSGNSFRERFQLATWVAGNVANSSELPSSGVATYNGHAIGNVASLGTSYIAAGNFQGTWNFGLNNGSVSITNFDRGGVLGAAGVSVSGGASGRPNYTGTVSGGFGLSGSVAGSFFKSAADAAAGMGGAFKFTNGTYMAAGTFAAQR